MSDAPGAPHLRSSFLLSRSAASRSNRRLSAHATATPTIVKHVSVETTTRTTRRTIVQSLSGEERRAREGGVAVCQDHSFEENDHARARQGAGAPPRQNNRDTEAQDSRKRAFRAVSGRIGCNGDRAHSCRKKPRKSLTKKLFATAGLIRAAVAGCSSVNVSCGTAWNGTNFSNETRWCVCLEQPML